MISCSEKSLLLLLELYFWGKSKIIIVDMLPNANRQIARAASTVMMAFIISNLIGLVRQIVIAHAFGTGSEVEAFNAANRVAEVLFNLTAGGALASAFVPTFTGLLAKEDKIGAWKLASAIANLLIGILILVAFLAVIFAPVIVQRLLAPGFEPEKQLLTIRLLRVLLPSVVIFGISGLVMGILNSHQKFLIPALTPAMYALGMIFGVVVLTPSLGIFGLAWGAVIGAALHLLLQIPSLLKLDGVYTAAFGLENSLVQQVGRLMLPRLFGAAIVQLNFWVNTLLASYLPVGSLNGIVYAFQLMLMPQAAIAQSIAIAAMPTFSAQAALGKLNEMRASLAASIRGVLLLSMPAAVGLMLLRTQIVALLYQRGVFDAHSTELVAWALLWYAAGLVGHSVVEILARAFYALHDTRTPVIVGAAAMGLNIGLSFLFIWLFSSIGWMPHGGLALANSTATALEMVVLMIIIRKKLSGIEGTRIVKSVWQGLIGVLLMIASIIVVLQILKGSSNAILCLVAILSGGLVYIVTLYLIQTEEVGMLISAVKRRLMGVKIAR
jgi:putative peptidoglycan lipid II flippase